MNENLKTRREHLKVLPLQKRLQAMENIRKVRQGNFSSALNELTSKRLSISGAFSYFLTRQGGIYWCKIEDKYFHDEQ
jgi:hypothetical protein